MIKKINGSFLILLFSSIIATALVLFLLMKTFPLFAAKALYFCQQSVSNTIFQIPHSFHYTFILILVAALALGALSFLIQLLKTHMLLHRLLNKKVNTPRRIQKILSPLGLENKLSLIKEDNLFSFCYGIFSPRIILTTALVSSLNDQELEAVLLHEKAHMQNLDPLKVLLGKTAASMFFFLPIFSELNKNMVATNELLADNFAIRAQNGTMFLRGALRKILSTPHLTFAAVPAISNSDHLEIRIKHLVNPSLSGKLPLSIMSITTSILFLVASWFILQSPVQAFQIEGEGEPAYFVCSSTDSICQNQCGQTSYSLPVKTPNDLFSPAAYSKNNQSLSTDKMPE